MSAVSKDERSVAERRAAEREAWLQLRRARPPGGVRSGRVAAAPIHRGEHLCGKRGRG